MKTYHLETINFTGSSVDLIKHLHKGSRAQAPDDKTWMAQTAERMMLINGHTLRTDTPDHFVDDMIENGAIDILVSQ